MTAAPGVAPVRFGFSQEEVEVIKATITPGATDAELSLFLRVCQKTGLDPFSRQIYLSSRRSKDKSGQWTDKKTPETTIDGFRVIAERSTHYAGQLGPFWCGDDGEWKDVWLDRSKLPSAAKVGVVRRDFSEPIWGTALFEEYVQTTSEGKPNSMWQKMGCNQLAKCAEALGLRKAFPRDLSGLYTREEMGQAENGVVLEQPPPLYRVGSKSQNHQLSAATASLAVGRKQAPVEVSSEPQPEGEGVSFIPESPVQNSDKPPFDPTPETEPPKPTIVPKPVPAKASESPTIVTVPGIPDAKVHDYLRGFLNVTKVPKTHPNMSAAIEYLASLDPLLVLRDPYALGVDLRDYMNDKPLYCEKMSPTDLRAFLRVLARGGFKLASKFRESAMEDGQPSKVLAEWEEAGMDLSTCSADDIESALLTLGPHSPTEALAAAHGDDSENPFAKLRGGA
jgi:phage recombination protein Bet